MAGGSPISPLTVGGADLSSEPDQRDFDDFFDEVEPRLRRALISRFGSEIGREATVDALVYGWRHWDRVRAMANPAGYLYRVGVSSVPSPAPPPSFSEPVTWDDPWVEPSLEVGLATLSDSQRTAVVLHHSLGWTHEEIADLLEVSASTIRNHIDRGMSKLRSVLKVAVDG